MQTLLLKVELTRGLSSAGLEKSPTTTPERLPDLNSLTLQRDIAETEEQSIELVWGFFFCM